MQTKASANFVKMSPKKVRLLADLIRGQDVSDALTRLKFNQKEAALPLLKLLQSAISNAEENQHLKKDNLYVKQLIVDGGPIAYRWMPRAMGRATPLRKRTSHIQLLLDERIATAETVKKAVKASADDLVTLADFDELKSPTKTGPAEKTDGVKTKGPRQAFKNKIFNRKSG